MRENQILGKFALCSKVWREEGTGKEEEEDHRNLEEEEECGLVNDIVMMFELLGKLI